MPDKVQTAFQRSIDGGRQRLSRSWPSLFATGAVGGIDVGLGVLALLVVMHATGNELLASLAFAGWSKWVSTRSRPSATALWTSPARARRAWSSWDQRTEGDALR